MSKIRSAEDLMQKLERMKEEVDGVKKAIPTATEEHLAEAHAYNRAFWEHMHTGIPENVLKKGSDGAGGYFVPDTYEAQLVEGMTEKNILRQIGKTISTTRDLHIPRILEGGSAEWIPENSFFAPSDLTAGEIVIGAHKIGTLEIVSDELLEDADFDLEAYLCRMFGERIGESEEAAFINGDGIGKPLGILSQSPVGTTTEEIGELHLDDMLDLMHSVNPQYRKDAVWLMSENAYLALRKVRNIHGRPLWTSKLSEGEPEMLFGHLLYVSKNMPDIAPRSKPVLFGNFDFYWIGDRGKRVVKRLSERYANQGQVGFLASQRVDAALVLPEAVKALVIREQ